jgi:hypothetical protein
MRVASSFAISLAFFVRALCARGFLGHVGLPAFHVRCYERLGAVRLYDATTVSFEVR